MGTITEQIRSTLPCFALSCADVGIHSTESESICTEPVGPKPLAGYRPATSGSLYSHIDLDILELDILMRMKAYGAAMELYEFGKHATNPTDGEHSAISLSFLATTSERSVVPGLDTFSRYYGGDRNYADTIIRGAMNLDNGFSATERRVRVVFACQYMVMYMATMQAMHDALDVCTSSQSDRDVASENWDKAAAFIIGQLEGTSSSGSHAGRLTWALSKQYCDEFDTCSNEVDGSSHNNDEIVTLLYAGRGALLSGNCNEIRKTTQELEPMLLVPLIQASMDAAVRLKGNKNEELKVAANMFAEATLPLIAEGNRDAASTIESHFSMTSSSMNDGGVSEVVNAYSKSLAGLGVDCRDLGETNEIDPCTGAVQSSGNKAALVVAILAMLCILVAIAGYCVFKRNWRKKDVKEKPEFVLPTGVLDHASDLAPSSQTTELLETPPESARGDAETDALNDGNADAVDDEDDAYMAAMSTNKKEEPENENRIV